MIETRDLTKMYGELYALNRLTIKLERGDVYGFIGPNGSGKTTTMQMLTGNLAPTSGEVDICGIDLIERPTQAKARIGYLPEVPPLYRELKVDEYLRLAGRLHKIKKGALPRAVLQAKNRCGLSDMGGRLIGALSKGYQQRVGIAQAIIHEPDVIILDEPTVGLDPVLRSELWDMFRGISDTGATIIVSSHVMDEALRCDRLILLRAGRIIADTTPQGLLAATGETDPDAAFLALIERDAAGASEHRPTTRREAREEPGA